jgi:hypothetical protein
MNRKDMSETISNFVKGTGGPYDWDDFISIVSKSEFVNRVKFFCNGAQLMFPSLSANIYCSEEGVKKLSELAKLLLNESEEDILDWINSNVPDIYK